MRDEYENIPGRHRFGEDSVGPVSNAEMRWIIGITLGVASFWALVLWLVLR